MPSVFRMITFKSNLRREWVSNYSEIYELKILWPDASSYFKAISSCSQVKCWGSGQPELMEAIFSQVQHTFNFSIIVLFHLGTSILSESLTGSQRRLGVNFTVQTLSNSFKNYIRCVTLYHNDDETWSRHPYLIKLKDTWKWQEGVGNV